MGKSPIARGKSSTSYSSYSAKSQLSNYLNVKITLPVNPRFCNKQNVLAINLLLTTLANPAVSMLRPRTMQIQNSIQKISKHSNTFQFLSRHRGFSNYGTPASAALKKNLVGPRDPREPRDRDLPCHRFFVVSDPLQALLHQLQGTVAGA